jgi:hypothetical protein
MEPVAAGANQFDAGHPAAPDPKRFAGPAR